MNTSNTAQIRKALNKAFDDSALSAFCLDYFPIVYEVFTQGMRKDDQITYLLDYLRRYPDRFKKLKNHLDQEYKISPQREELKPLIDALSEYIGSSSKPKSGPIGGKSMRTHDGLLANGTRLNDRYRITHCIAKGGFGAVYKADDLHNREIVAIKELIYHHWDNYIKRLKAFKRESEQLRKLDYHTIPRVRDDFEEDDWPYLVMDFIEGQTLKEELIVRRKPFEVAQVLRWADSLLNTLEYLHKQTPPLIHRDIKPDNLKRKNENEVFLLDFGIAKGGSPQHKDTILHGFTRGYSPPEQTAPQMTTDVRSELYALGATLYRLLTNERPPETALRLPHLMLLNSDPLKPANELNPSVPSKLAEVLTKAMAIKPDERFQNVAEMRHALDASSDDSSRNNEQIDQGKDTNTFRRRIVRVAVGAVAVIAVVMILVMLITNIIPPSTGQIEVYMDQQPLDLEQLPQLTAGEAVTLEVKVIDKENQTHEGGDLECTWTVEPQDQNNQIKTDECQTLYIPSTQEQTQTVTIEVRSRQQKFEDTKSITFDIQN